jgi:phosphoribosylaminoimidazole-succinocarboxamide synthase
MNLGDESPNFTAPSTHGNLTWHSYIENSWGILFSHPAAHTPVCTTELARVAQLLPEFERRNCKVAALSCDTVEKNNEWIPDILTLINTTSTTTLPFPIISDPKRDLAEKFKMLDAVAKDASGIALTARAVFVFGPDRKLKFSILYPATTGRNFDEILRAIDSVQLTALKRLATPVNWCPGEDCVVASSVGQDEAHVLFPSGVKTVPLPSKKPYLRYTADPRGTTTNTTTTTSNNNKRAPLIILFLSSKTEQPHAEKITKEIHNFGIEYEMRVCSSLKAPTRLMELIDRYERLDRPKVYIACSSKNNSLGGLIDANVMSPIISCPPYSDVFGGSDILSSLRMPTGVTPMVILDPQNAALAAVKIFALYDSKLAEKIRRVQSDNAALLHVQDCDVKSSTYIPKIFTGLTQTFDSTDIVLKPKNGTTSVTKYVGKVRDRYNDGKNVILVTTDRLTAFDRPLAKIPFKGAVLNLVSKWWFEETSHIIPNHVLSVPHPNVTIGVAAKPFPIEFVVRGYITGSSGTSMWTHYQNGVRDYCGIHLPEGLVQHQKLWKNLITPTTKSDTHDELISPQQIVDRGYMTQEEWDYCSRKALELFDFAQNVALKHGLILVDTKMEMGRAPNGDIILIDEIFTPDSSRYWIASSYEVAMQQGKSPQNIDKEFVRLWFKDHCDPYKDEVLPEAPKDIIAELSRRYIMLYELITGLDFPFPNSMDVNRSVQMALDKMEV